MVGCVCTTLSVGSDGHLTAQDLGSPKALIVNRAAGASAPSPVVGGREPEGMSRGDRNLGEVFSPALAHPRACGR
jgi:hypothetical protein